MRYTIQTRNWLKLRRSEIKTWQQTRLDYFNTLLKADRLSIDHKPVHREKIRFGAWKESPEVEISEEAYTRVHPYLVIPFMESVALGERGTVTEQDRYMSIGPFVEPAFYRFPLDAIWDAAEQDHFYRRKVMAVFRVERIL